MLNKLGRITRLNPDRVRPDAPPGQFVTDKFPVLTFGPTPRIDLDAWQFRVSGLVEDEITLDWQQFNDLPQATLDAEFHCVYPVEQAPEHLAGHSVHRCHEARHAQAGGEVRDGALPTAGTRRTSPLDVLLDDDVLFAHSHDGGPLTPQHGGPMRLVVPKRYGWKSAKWVNGIEFMAEDEPGFWEMRGYHMEGDPWKEERFWSSLTY